MCCNMMNQLMIFAARILRCVYPHCFWKRLKASVPQHVSNTLISNSIVQQQYLFCYFFQCLCGVTYKYSDFITQCKTYNSCEPGSLFVAILSFFREQSRSSIHVKTETWDINEHEEAASGLLWYLAQSLVVALITKTAYLSSKPYTGPIIDAKHALFIG